MFCIGLLGITLVCLIGIPAVDPNNKFPYGDLRNSNTIKDAKLYGRKAVQQHLKWPDDAEFLGGEEVFYVEGKPMYFQVVGKVKAANALGAKLTHPFVAEVRLHHPARKEWRFHYVELNGEVLFDSPWPSK